MTPRRRYAIRAARYLAAASCVALGTPPVAARELTAPAIAISEPEGFADLTREQTLLVDIYFGGVDRGEAKVKVSPGKLTFLDPQALLRILPDASDSAKLESLLAGQALATNSELACTQGSDRETCGRLAPETVGVIYDRDRLRVDVFLNPRFLAVHDNLEDRYLPAPGGGVSVINSIGAVYSGQTGPGDDYYNLHDRIIVGDGERRLRADISLASKLGFGAESVALEWDRPEFRYSAGELWARGNDISGRRKLLGAGIETQIDTRLDKDQVYGSPIVVYLDRRARVDILRDGRILSSAIYDAGNQQVDTADLPDGSYAIVLRIQEAGQPAREERRFFSKSRRLPSLGRTDFFAFGGTLVKGSDSGSLEPSSHPYAEAGVARRLSRHFALEGDVAATDRTGTGEIAATFISSLVQARAAAVADTAGTVGGILQLASTGNSRVNFNLDMRHIESGRARPDAATDPAPLGAALFGSPDLDEPMASYSQASGYLSYSMARLRLVGTAIYRKDAGESARYSVGPSVEWDALRRGRWKLTLHGDFAATERGNSGFAGVSLQLLSGHLSLAAQGGARSSSIAGDELGEGAVGSIAGTFETQAAGGELAVGAGYQHQPLQDDVILSSEFRHPIAELAADYDRSKQQGQAAVSQYSLGFQTTLIVGGGAIKLAGRTATESMIVAGVEGARPGDRFEVLVNEQVAGTIIGAHVLSLPLPAYRAYQVRIRPVGAGLLAYDGSVRSVGLYPGAVTRLDWSASPVVIEMGSLVAPDGSPLAGATISGKGAWSETDGQGRFQIEAPQGAQLTVTTKDGRSYPLTLPAPADGAEIARLGAVRCCSNEPVRLGALDRAAYPSLQKASQ